MEVERRLGRSQWSREKGEVVQRRVQREPRVSYHRSHTHSGTCAQQTDFVKDTSPVLSLLSLSCGHPK